MENGKEFFQLILEHLKSLDSKVSGLDSKVSGVEIGQKKMQRDIDRIGVKVSDIDNTIRYIFDDIYKLEKRIDGKNS
ncbi:MAG: hypothetical protein AWM53_01272 [Candidatus Dichloromethanomonas elyunquensis]|nr:MAG: hypothetical protein AWM53_01272 [Candidatus Dichloromethanomonas elyunquensis]